MARHFREGSVLDQLHPRRISRNIWTTVIWTGFHFGIRSQCHFKNGEQKNRTLFWKPEQCEEWGIQNFDLACIAGWITIGLCFDETVSLGTSGTWSLVTGVEPQKLAEVQMIFYQSAKYMYCYRSDAMPLRSPSFNGEHPCFPQNEYSFLSMFWISRMLVASQRFDREQLLLLYLRDLQAKR